MCVCVGGGGECSEGERKNSWDEKKQSSDSNVIRQSFERGIKRRIKKEKKRKPEGGRLRYEC